VIIILAVFWYGMVPVAGAFSLRRAWRTFRRFFNELRQKPYLDYAAYCRGEGGVYRFIGGFESVTDGHTLWIRGDELTVPVALNGAQTYVLPMPGSSDSAQSGGSPAEAGEDAGQKATAGDRVKKTGTGKGDIHESFDPGKETPQKIRWEQVTSLTEGAKVFVGGTLIPQKDRLTFVADRGKPLLVIFYDGPDRSLSTMAIRAGREDNEYWNHITPYAFLLGVFSQIIMVLKYIHRPAFRLTVMTALAALFTPLYTLFPPGCVFTIIYRRLWWQGRVYRAYRDLVSLPLNYTPERRVSDLPVRLPDGELYGGVYYRELPEDIHIKIENGEIPLLIPEIGVKRNKAVQERDSAQDWYIFGALENREEKGLPAPPRDVLATYGAIPGNPEFLARYFTVKAYVLEIISWVLLLTGIILNTVCIALIILNIQG
jgi:hypothetical protein